jgi:hypothetical protein
MVEIKTEQGSGVGSLTAGQRAALSIVLLVAAFVRFYQIGGPSLWMDEMWSVEISTGRGSAHDVLPVGVVQDQQMDLTSLADAPPWWNIWTHMSGVVHPPLYHVALRWWMDLFGNGPAAVRGLSAAMSVVAVFVLFDVCRLLHGVRIGLLAAAIMAVAISPIEYGQEARSYSMMILLGLCCCDAVVRVEKLGVNPFRLAGLVLATASLALTHYFSIGAFIALAGYAALRLRGKDRLKVFAAFAAAMALVAIVWGPLLIRQIHSLPSLQPDYMQESEGDHVGMTFLRVLGLPAEFLFGQTTAFLLPLVVLRAVGIGAILVPAIRLNRRKDLLLWVLWIWGCLGFLVVFDLARHTMMTRFIHYSLIASPAVVAVVAATDWPRRPVVRDCVALLVLMVLTILSARRVMDGVAPVQQWRELVTRLDAAAGPDELLVFSGADPWVTPGFDYVAFKYYAPRSNRPWLVVEGQVDPELMAKLQERDSLWLVGVLPQDATREFVGWSLDGPPIETTANTACHLVRQKTGYYAQVGSGYGRARGAGYHRIGAFAALHDE